MIVILSIGQHDSSSTSQAQTTYDRVIESKTIRCGYVIRYPFLLKDAEGRLSGLAYDYINLMASNLGLKVEWVQEAGYGEMVQDLVSGRYDMFCTPIWITAARAKQIDFTLPTSFSLVYAYVRADDKRFDVGYSAMNVPTARFTIIDGVAQSKIVHTFFDKAKVTSLPAVATYEQMVLDIKFNKADLALLEHSFAQDFMKKNPNVLRRVPLPPLVEFPLTFGIPSDYRFKMMINGVTSELINNGTVEALYRKYQVEDVHILPKRVYP